MATGEKNDNTDEYSLPTELLAKNSNEQEQDFLAGKTKLKDLLSQPDSHINFNSKEVPTTKEINLILSDNNFNECVHERDIQSNGVTNRLDLNSTNTSASTISGINSSSKVNLFLTDSKFKYGSYRLPIFVSTTKCLGGVDSKLQHNSFSSNNNADSVRGAKTPSSSIEKVLATDEDRLCTPGLYENANEFVFQDSTYDASIARFETEDEWDMAMNQVSSPRPTPVVTCSKPATHTHTHTQTLFIKQAGTTDALKKQIMQIVGESEMTVLSLEESFDVGTKADMYSLVWFHLLSPLSKRAIEIMSLLKYSSMKNILPIVVTNKLIKDDLPIQADLFVEPLTKDTVESLCSNVKASISKINSNLHFKQSTSAHNFASTPESTISSASGRTSIGSHSPPRWCRVEHATKEKQRRERIKDSCDQLRVLLPYVKGRKTDMASILEMTVDYLKIVNSALSQDFHSQVIDIMSSGNSPVEDDYFSMNMAYKKTIRKEEDGLDTSSASAKSFHAVLTKTETKASKTNKKGNMNLNNRMVTRSVSRSLTSVEDEMHSPDDDPSKNRRNPYGNINNRIIVTKRGCSTAQVGSSNPKKPHLPLVPQDKQPRTIQASTTSVLKDYKTENAIDDQPSQNHLYHNLQFPHMFTEGDISANRMFSSGHLASNDGFAYISHSQINLQSTHNASSDRSDVNNYGNVYFDGSYLPYSYSNHQDSNNNGSYYGTEYVNPNAVLPVTSYMPRVSAFASGRKFERPSTSNSEMLQCDTDVYNNNTETNIKSVGFSG